MYFALTAGMKKLVDLDWLLSSVRGPRRYFCRGGARSAAKEAAPDDPAL
jgi:hypothetical protein